MGDFLVSLFRIILIVINFIIFVCGVLLFTFGIIGVASPQTVTYILYLIPGVANAITIIDIPQLLINCSVYMIILGVILIAFGFAGCCGLLRYSTFWLFLYWIGLIVLVLIEVSLMIVALVVPNTLQGQVQSMLLTSLRNNFQPVTINPTNGDITLPPYPVAAAWVTLQFESGCCGAGGPSDFKSFSWNNSFVLFQSPVELAVDAAVVPPSCCMLLYKGWVPDNIRASFIGLGQCLNGLQFINTQGCYNSVMDMLNNYAYIAVGICAAVIFFQLIACCVTINEWRESKKTEKK